jgi:hypothetical protein
MLHFQCEQAANFDILAARESRIPADGAARMGRDPSTSVVDKFGRTHDIPNLLVCDGSILPTQGSANPGLTIQALAARTADYLIKQGDAIFYSNRRDLNEPGIRYDLSPPYTWFKGNPRIRISRARA